MKKLLSLFSLTFLAYANEVNNIVKIEETSIKEYDKKSAITLQWLETKPYSTIKDFYILQYLKQDITPDEALEALSMVKSVSNTIFFQFAKKFKHDETIAVVQCMKASAKDLIDTDANCIKNGLSLKQATKLSQIELLTIIKKVEEKYPNFAQQLKIIAAPIPFTKLISSDIDDFYEVFLNTGVNFKIEHFNYKLPLKTINKIKDDKRVEKLIKYCITNPKLNLLNKSFLNFEDTTLSSKSSFFLALNSIIYNDFNQAFIYLNNSLNKTTSIIEKNKINFWLYLLTKDENYLETLSTNTNVDIYSLYVKELKNIPIKNIKYNISLKQNETKESFDTKDPFSWFNLLEDTKEFNEEKFKKYENLFNKKETLPFLAFIYNKYDNYKTHYFLTPFEEELKNYDIDRKALIYAISRQESRFIPTALSSVYAQGVMQIMPFLSEHIAKDLKDEYDFNKMFETKTNLKYANYHLNNLQKNLDNPLFIAYSYNAGYGYFKSLKNLGLFSKNNQFEPFLSMELISYDETKEYGKKVLANYYIYKNYLDNKKEHKLSFIFHTLIQPLAN
ncbi:lytic murein transglycosylase [Malaciobacter mytili LMG 24559]|uniref:Lytic murein transglycosylase n=1 Tax=Malaciobacter mytili LMG 24559 TaxID=1032238 RepID=A0AAX2AKT5_9BACT|nr:lytic transglycosylase domain-containing protein [Malaciobacter mytili]AXH15039.1 soluble lytic murein transglycosylase [Malaciobacter mytili LMG 24559]RXK16723.1 lytic murein transglycosylase [Malaciobacter mytili LMG 24559]